MVGYVYCPSTLVVADSEYDLSQKTIATAAFALDTIKPMAGEVDSSGIVDFRHGGTDPTVKVKVGESALRSGPFGMKSKSLQ